MNMQGPRQGAPGDQGRGRRADLQGLSTQVPILAPHEGASSPPTAKAGSSAARDVTQETGAQGEAEPGAGGGSHPRQTGPHQCPLGPAGGQAHAALWADGRAAHGPPHALLGLRRSLSRDQRSPLWSPRDGQPVARDSVLQRPEDQPQDSISDSGLRFSSNDVGISEGGGTGRPGKVSQRRRACVGGVAETLRPGGDGGAGLGPRLLRGGDGRGLEAGLGVPAAHGKEPVGGK